MSDNEDFNIVDNQTGYQKQEAENQQELFDDNETYSDDENNETRVPASEKITNLQAQDQNQNKSDATRQRLNAEQNKDIQDQDPQQQQNSKIPDQPRKSSKGLNFDDLSKTLLSDIVVNQAQKEKIETIESAYLQRKRQSFKNLKEWDSQRDEFIQNHKSISNHLIFRIQEISNTSCQVFTQIESFFEKYKAVLIANCNSIKQNTPKLSSIQQMIDPQNSKVTDNSEYKQEKINWYPALANSLQKVDVVFESQFKQIEDLVKFVDVDILKQQILPQKKSYNQKIKDSLKEIKSKQDSIKKQENVVKQRLVKYTNIFKASVDQKQKNKKDLYLHELQYREAFQLYFQQFKELGQLIYQLIHDLKELERSRVKCIQQVFKAYIEKNLQIYGTNKELNDIVGHFSVFQAEQETEKSFQIENFLTKEQIDYIDQGKHQNQTTFDSLKNYLFNFKFPALEDMENGQHRLVLKKQDAFMDTGTFGLTWKPVQMVFTIDDYLLIFERDEKKEKEELVCPCLKYMQCQYIRFQERKKNNQNRNLCYINEHIRGTFIDHNKKVLIKFDNEDRLLEFQIYLQRYGVTLLEDTQNE